MVPGLSRSERITRLAEKVNARTLMWALDRLRRHEGASRRVKVVGGCYRCDQDVATGRLWEGRCHGNHRE
jgi:hypothetical protein